MPAFTWDDAEKIAMALLAKFPTQDPLHIRFADAPASSSESALEFIQMAWWEEWKECQA